MAMPQVTRKSAATISQRRADGRSAASLLYLECDGTVVRALDQRHDARGLDAATQLVRDEEVVDAPADIAGARAGLHVPPRIVPRLGHEDPEGVGIAAGGGLGAP